MSNDDMKNSNTAATITASADDGNSNNNIQIRVSFHLAKEYYNVVPSLHVPTDSIVVPNNINRKGLSLIINHLLGRQPNHDTTNEGNDDDDNDHNDDALPSIPFEFMIGGTNNNKDGNSTKSSSSTTTTNRLLRYSTSGGLEREVRKLGTLSLEESIPLIYFPAQLPPQPFPGNEQEPFPDWISTMECIRSTKVLITTTTTTDNDTTASSSSSLLCTGCYDGSIVLLNNTGSSTNNSNSNTTNSISSTSAMSTVCTISQAHDGPIHCLSTTPMMKLSKSATTTTTVNNSTKTTNSSFFVATGSMDQTLRVHQIQEFRNSNNKNEKDEESSSPPTYEVSSVIDCSVNGHNASISSVDTFLLIRQLDEQHVLYLASGDWEGNVCIWKYDIGNNETEDNRNNNHNEDYDTTTKKKKSKVSTDRSNKDMEIENNDPMIASSIRKRKKISAIHSYRAHTTKVSGISWGNYEKIHSPNTLPKHLFTCSWDHSIKVWDVDHNYDIISTMNGLRVITCMDTSHFVSSHIIVTGHPDCTIRLWDVRSSDTNTNTATGSNAASERNIIVSDTSFRPRHKEWISSVKWSPNNPYHIISTSYDNTILLWDIRTSVPLHSMSMKNTDTKNQTLPLANTERKDDEKGLCVCYHPSGSYIYGGGTDGIVKMYRL